LNGRQWAFSNLVVVVTSWTLLRNDEAPGSTVSRPRSTVRPGASRACSPVVDRPAPSRPAISGRSSRLPAAGDRHAVARTGIRAPGPARPRPIPGRGDEDDPDEGVRDSGRHPAADRPDRSRHPGLLRESKRHGMNVQVLTGPFGRLLWASPALPGSTHDLTAARHHGITEALAEADLKCRADKAYQEAGGPVRVPFHGRSLKRWTRHHNTTRPDPLPRRTRPWPPSRGGTSCGNPTAARTGSRTP